MKRRGLLFLTQAVAILATACFLSHPAVGAAGVSEGHAPPVQPHSCSGNACPLDKIGCHLDERGQHHCH